MDPRKFHQLQAANGMHKKLPLTYHTNATDYYASQSAVSKQQHHHQQQHYPNDYKLLQQHLGDVQYLEQSPTYTMSSGEGYNMTVEIQPQNQLSKYNAKLTANNAFVSSPYSAAQPNSGGDSSDNMYQSTTERSRLTAASRLRASANPNQASSLQHQYQQLQHAKMQAQLQTQNEAVLHQQRTFAMRQALNPPIPHSNMSQSSSIMSAAILQQQQQNATFSGKDAAAAAAAAQQQLLPIRAPPSTLNLVSQFQPADGPIKYEQGLQQQQKYHQMSEAQNQQLNQHLQLQQQQLQYQLGIEPSPVYIQQNHPGHVVNQACQTQISAVKTDNILNKMTPSSEESVKSPIHSMIDRKKSTGSTQALKSPITKRHPASKVTMSGWLYKQGSDGLKVWRKRWFVLAEYCLFYYKGPEEEKLLGSILLPSYKISACLPEDRVYKKFAFKCEHQNMRTYCLATDTAESMIQWVRALSAASMMQASLTADQLDQTLQPSASSSLNHSGENSDSGVHTIQSQQSKMSLSQGSGTPASEYGALSQNQNSNNNNNNHSNNNNNNNNNNFGNNSAGDTQPLYANAPPKPRRVTDGGYSSPSPEHINNVERNKKVTEAITSRRIGNDLVQPTGGPSILLQQHHAIYDTRTGNVSTALRLQQSHQMHSIDNLERNIQQKYSALTSSHGNHPNDSTNMDKRNVRPQSRYEDVIWDEQRDGASNSIGAYLNVERRTPEAYGRSKRNIPLDYEDIYNYQHRNVIDYNRPTSPYQFDGTKLAPILYNRQSESQRSNVRPHSADFLDYEARNTGLPDTAIISNNTYPISQMKNIVNVSRPKSSLEINRTLDSVYYSEASYAEKMRKSALYLQNSQSRQGMQQQQQQQQQGQASTPKLSYPITQDMGQLYNVGTPDNEFATMKDDLDILKPADLSNLSTQQIIQQNEQFLRSASARLPKRNTTFDDNNGVTPSENTDDQSDLNLQQDNERKREESMKRLLEWKQRMLQSPLTRKSAQHVLNLQKTNAVLDSNTDATVEDGGISAKYGQQTGTKKKAIDNVSYNIYSSDDEASFALHSNNVNHVVKQDHIDVLTQIRNGTQTFENSYSGVPYDAKYAKMATIENKRENDKILANGVLSPTQQQILSSTYYKPTDGNCDMTAGDLLSRTHEELVLLLIQLRRQSSNTARSIEHCCGQMHALQDRLRTAEGILRSDGIQRLDYLKQHLMQLERQYEKSKPLINLVDNMVKLGSLYRYDTNAHLQKNLEFQQQLQERCLLEEERKRWERLTPNNNDLQMKVWQLYEVDELLQEESKTLQTLQREKEELEHALGGLRQRIHTSNMISTDLEAARKERHILEQELSCVHRLLADNAKKLEDTVTGNTRLEQELLVLRQKLQEIRTDQTAGSAMYVSDTFANNTSAMLELELKRVQTLVGDMQRQRLDLSIAVNQLTENSSRLFNEIGCKDSENYMFRKRTNSSCWVETDLDSMISANADFNDSTTSLSTPLFVDTNYIYMNGSMNLENNKVQNLDNKSGLYDNGEYGTDLNACLPVNSQDKQEIKTVRIVKRESERRHRDRSERSGLSSSTQNLDHVREEDSYLSDASKYKQMYGCSMDDSEIIKKSSHSLPLQSVEPGRIRSRSHNRGNTGQDSNRNFSYSSDVQAMYNNNPKVNSESSVKTRKQIKQQKHNLQIELNSGLRHAEQRQSLNKSLLDLQSGPIFQSEAAKQIMTELSAGSASEDTEKVIEKVQSHHKYRRVVPREKRRHNTAPNNVNRKAIERVQAENDMNRNNTCWRARDDLDMEVALRPRSNAPDVVRSALGHREKISENTIENLLLAPNKIVIPERYIPETTPELSPEEKKRRQDKVEAIKKMLSDAPMGTANDPVSAPPRQSNAERKEREHLLQLNQILAQQVMQMSKIVAEKAMANKPEDGASPDSED